MNEEDKRMEEVLDRLLARVRAESSPLPTADPNLPARVRAMSVAFSEDVTVHERPRRWVRASLSVAALILIAGMGAYVGYGAAPHSLSSQQTNDVDTFIMALSQSGFADKIARLHREDYQ
jgi:hypothetical protein